MKPSEQLAGVLPVLETPFHDDGSVDFATLDREIDWVMSRGADGVVMAMVSEVLRLGESERREVAEGVCARVGGRGHVVVSVGAESAQVAERYVQHAEKAGTTALMAIPPVSIGCAESEQRGYFDRIFAAVAIPLVAQDASGYVGRPMSIAFQAGPLEKWGERAHFKPEAAPIGPRLSALRDATGGRAKIFEAGSGIALVDSFRRGIVGTMPGADLIDRQVAPLKAPKSGSDAAKYPIALPLSMLISLEVSLDSLLAVEEHLLVRQGIFKNQIVRGPRRNMLDDETRREVDRLFERLRSVVAG